MPTKWYNVMRGELFSVLVEKQIPIPPGLLALLGNLGDNKRGTRSTTIKRGSKISKLHRLVETASRRYPVSNMHRRRTTTTPAVTLPQVSHRTTTSPDIPNVIGEDTTYGVKQEDSDDNDDNDKEDMATKMKPACFTMWDFNR